MIAIVVRGFQYNNYYGCNNVITCTFMHAVIRIITQCSFYELYGVIPNNNYEFTKFIYLLLNFMVMVYQHTGEWLS